MGKLGTYDHYFEVSIEDVLDEVSTEDLEEYLAGRRDEKGTECYEDGARNVIIALCKGRMRRNLENDREEVKAAICEIIDELF